MNKHVKRGRVASLFLVDSNRNDNNGCLLVYLATIIIIIIIIIVTIVGVSNRQRWRHSIYINTSSRTILCMPLAINLSFHLLSRLLVRSVSREKGAPVWAPANRCETEAWLICMLLAPDEMM